MCGIEGKRGSVVGCDHPEGGHDFGAPVMGGHCCAQVKNSSEAFVVVGTR